MNVPERDESAAAEQGLDKGWEPKELTRVSAALALSESATADDRVNAANVLIQSRVKDQPFDPTGSTYFSGKTPTPSEFYDLARYKIFEIGPESILTPEYKELMAAQDDEEKVLGIAKSKLGPFQRVLGKIGDLTEDPFAPLTDEELKLADEETKAAHQILADNRRYRLEAQSAYSSRRMPTDVRPPTAEAGSPEFKAAAEKVAAHRRNVKDRGTIADYQSKVLADNVWYQYQLVKDKLDPDTDEIVRMAFSSKTLTPRMADKFRNLKDGDQQRLAASLIYGAKLQGDKALLRDAGREFAATLIDVPKDAFESLFVDSVKRLVMDDAQYQKQAETAALLAEAEAPRMAEYGYWGDAVIGFAATIPYMGYAMIPYAGTPMIAAKAAKDFEERVAASGGDVTSGEFQAAKWSSAIAYAAVEKMQALRIAGPIDDMVMRQAYLKFWKKANIVLIARNTANNVVSETWQEGVQKAVEDGFVSYGLGQDVARNAAMWLVQELKDSFGTMAFVAGFGIPVQAVRSRATRNHTLSEIISGSLHASALIDAHRNNDAEAIAKHRAALASLSRQIRDAGSTQNAIDQLKAQGVDEADATVLTVFLENEARMIRKDAGLTEDQKEELIGKERTAVEVMQDLMPDAHVEANAGEDGTPDGTFTIRRTVAGTETVTRVVPVENVEYDLSTPEAAASALKRLNEYGANLTTEAWNGMTEDEKRQILAQKGISKASAWRFESPSGQGVTDGQLKVLTGEIQIAKGMEPSSIFHEYFHGMISYLTETKALKPADVAKLREEFGPPAEGVDEQFNEEDAADRFKDYAAKKVHFTQSSALEKVWEAAADLLSKAKELVLRTKPAQPTIDEAMFEQVISGEYTGIPVATVRKSKEKAQKPPAPEPSQAQDEPETGTQPDAAPAEIPPSNANVGPNTAKPPASQGGMNLDGLKAKDQQKVADKGAKLEIPAGEWRSRTPKGEMIVGGHIAIMPNSAIVNSFHDNYHQPFQNRGRDSLESRIQINRIKDDPHSDELLSAPTTDSGSPKVHPMHAPAGMYTVISGNGRERAMEEMAQEGTYEERLGYAVRHHAQKLGMDLAGIDNPTYVEVIDWVQYPNGERKAPTEEDLVLLAKYSNKDKILAMNESEQAENDAKMIVAKGMIKLFAPGIGGNIMALSNAQFMTAFIRATDASNLVNSDGHPTDLAERRVKRALLALLIGEGENARQIIRSLTENAAEMGMGTVVDGVLKSIGDIVGISQAKPSLSIVDATGMALRDYLEMKIAGFTNAQNWVNQGDLYDTRPQAVASLVQAFAARANTSIGIAAIFRDYAAKARIVDVSTGSLGLANVDTMESLLDKAIADTASEAEADAKAQASPTPADADKATVPPPQPVAKRQEEAKKQAKPEIRTDPKDYGVEAMLAQIDANVAPAPVNHDPTPDAQAMDADGQMAFWDEMRYWRETPTLPASLNARFLGENGTVNPQKASWFLPYPLAGNKAHIFANHADFFTALAKKSTAVWDLFGGAATYVHNLAEIGALPANSRWNEWEYTRFIATEQIKLDQEGVIAALDDLSNRLQAAIPPGNREGDAIAADRQKIIDWLNAELRGEHGHKYVPDQMQDEAGRVVLNNTAATAALYLLMQNISYSARAQDVSLIDGKPTWTTAGDDFKPTATSGTVLTLIDSNGKWSVNERMQDYESIIPQASKHLQGVTVTQGDGWAAATEAPPGALVFIDSSYFGAMNYGLKTREDGDVDTWLAKVKEYLAKRKDLTYVITNNWNFHAVEELQKLGFLVARTERANETPELVALSGNARNLVAEPIRTVDQIGQSVRQPDIQQAGTANPADGPVQGSAGTAEGQGDGTRPRNGEAAGNDGTRPRLTFDRTGPLNRDIAAAAIKSRDGQGAMEEGELKAAIERNDPLLPYQVLHNWSTIGFTEIADGDNPEITQAFEDALARVPAASLPGMTLYRFQGYQSAQARAAYLKGIKPGGYIEIQRPTNAFSRHADYGQEMADAYGGRFVVQFVVESPRQGRDVGQLLYGSRPGGEYLYRRGDRFRVASVENGENGAKVVRLEESSRVGRKEAGRFSFDKPVAPAFYSQLRRVIEQKVPNRATVAQIRATIDPAKGNGVKADEVFWSGLQEFLDGKKPTDMVTKEEVLAATREVVVTDVVKGAYRDSLYAELRRKYNIPENDTIADHAEELSPEDYAAWNVPEDSADHRAKFENYVLPGGENYRELLLTLPSDEYHVALQRYAKANDIQDIGKAEQAFQAETGRRPNDSSPDFRSGHFSEPNIVAHVRFNERVSADGKRTLFIEEIQSDWAQSIRSGGNMVPDAPFVTKTDAWVSLALKRMVRWAAENGFEQIAWTTGEQQADRYDLSKQLDEVEAFKSPSGLVSITAKKNGEILLRKEKIQPNELPGIVGKELAEKINSQKYPSEKRRTYSGLDLKVGGEGMKSFYDQIVPNTANKLFKRFGAKTTETDIGTSGEHPDPKRLDSSIPRDPSNGGRNRDKIFDHFEAEKNVIFGVHTDGKRVRVAGVGGAVDGVRIAANLVENYNKTLKLWREQEQHVMVHAMPITAEMRESVMTEGQARFSFARMRPEVSGNSAAIASLAVQKLAGKEIGTEQAARAMYLFKPEGATADQLLAEANKMADGAIGQAAKRALESADPTKAMTIIAANAEMQAAVAARAGAVEGAATALRMGKTAARGEAAAMKQLLIAAKGENLQQFEMDTGISWTETLLSFLPEKWKEWEDDAKKGDQAQGPQKPGDEPEPPKATEQELAEREKRMSQLIEAAQAWDAQRRAKLEKERDDKKAEDAKEGAGGETEETDEAEEAAIPAIPKELLEAHGVDLTSPEAIAHAIRLWIGDWIVRNSDGRLTPETVWKDPEAVEMYRKTIRQQLEDMAAKLLDPSDSGPVFVARMIGDLPRTGRPDTFERRTALILASIQAHAIRQSRRELVNGIRKTIDAMAKQGKKFDPMEEDLKRKVSAEPEKIARYVKQYIGWGADKCHAELEKLQAQIEARQKIYDEQHGSLDETADIQLHYDQIKLAMLARWGNLKSMLPAEIKAAGEEITAWLSSEQERLQRDWFRQAEANSGMMTAILEGVVPTDPEKAKQEPGAIQQFVEAHTYMVRQRLEALLRHGDPAKRDAAMRAIEEVMFQMSRGTEVYEATRLKYRKQWDDAVIDATRGLDGKVDRKAAADWIKHLDEPIPDEISNVVSRQGYRGTMTYGQAIQLYVGLTQRFYADNVMRNKRADHAAKIRSILTPADLKMVTRMRDIYEQRRAELSAVVRKVTGLDVWRPDPLYMPVQMYLGSRGGLGTAGSVRAWKSLSDALTPRVRNNRDFDESVDIQSMFYQRMEDTARAIGYGARGLTIRGVLGKKDLHDVVERYYGKKTVAELMKHVTQAMAGVERHGEGSVESTLAMIRKANTYMALSYNVLSMAKQVGSVPAFMFKLGTGEFVTAISQYDAASWAELKDSDGFKARYMGGIAPEVMEILDDHSQSKLKRAYKAGMVTVQAGDYLAAKIVATGIYKAKVQQLANKGMPMDQAKERAKTETWAIVEETQQSGRTENVSGVYRNYGEMAKLIFQFASAPLMQLSHEYHAAMDAKAGVPGAKERLMRAVLLNHVIIPGIMSTIAWAFNSLLLGDEPPEDRDTILEVVANNLMFEPLSRILIVGSVMEAVGNSVLKGKLPGFSNDVPASRLARTVGYAGRSVHDLFTADIDQFQADILELAKQASAPIRHVSEFIENRIIAE